MITHIIAIGNSRGVRIPKILLEKAGFSDEAEILERGGNIVIRPLRQVRKGWEESFRRMAAAGDDNLLDTPVPTEWDEAEWQW